MIKAAINGFGRIGRLIARAIYQRHSKIGLVFINSPGTAEDKYYWLKYDSTHGAFDGVKVKSDHIVINGNKVLCNSYREPHEVDCTGIDVLFECSGQMKNRAHDFIKRNARKVIVSAPAKNVNQTAIFGVSEIDKNAKVISAGSCTTNALAVLVNFVKASFEINHINATTIHAYTNDQRIVDSRHQDPYRGRAAALSIIPTKTGAAQTIYSIFPELKGKIECTAYRVPTSNVSMLDLYISVRNCELTASQVNDLALKYCKRSPSIMSYNDEKLVSVDFNHTEYTVAFDANATKTGTGFIKIAGWYDNEWGFANRMIDIAESLYM